ncbi:unnamed protein product [Gordionus sp. m RMFG-2023]
MWSVDIRSSLLCTQVKNPYEAQYAKVMPISNTGACEMVKINHKKLNINFSMWIEYQKVKYIFDDDKQIFQPIKYPIYEQYNYYHNYKGLTDDFKGLIDNNYINIMEHVYGLNKMNIEIPDFMELMKDRSTSPFFVFQVLCVCLWSLYDQFYYSLFTLLMLVVFEATLVKQQLKNMSEIRKMGNKSFIINVYRNKRWRLMSSENLLPGDICSITRNKVVPCDVLLLKGTCIVDESMLTGESVPQPKESIENENGDQILDLSSEDSKLRVLYGGTHVIQTLTPPNKNKSGWKSPDNGCLVHVLRTGFSTSQGKLLSTILGGVKLRGGFVGGSENWETCCFIGLLLVFAIAASIYVWIQGTLDPARNRYKLLLECVLIITSVVPPELPIELSLAINSSLLALSKLSIFCTEPFRIPFAGKLDVCCFDKTGTLTTDDFVIDGVVEYISDKENDGTQGGAIMTQKFGDNSLVPLEECSRITKMVLGTCHSLINLPRGEQDDQLESGPRLPRTHGLTWDINIIGDPLEKAILQELGWNLTKNDVVIGVNKTVHELTWSPLKILHRFHFLSALKRMSVIISYKDMFNVNKFIYQVVIKGAPEVLKPMFINAPEDYDQTYLKFANKGGRVLALGSRILPAELFDTGKSSNATKFELNQDTFEKELIFRGFLIVSCPLKASTGKAINELIHSNHKIVMITGDNHLTACHVGHELGIVSSKQIYMLQIPAFDTAMDGYDLLTWKPLHNSNPNHILRLCPRKLTFQSLHQIHPSSESNRRAQYDSLNEIKDNRIDLCLTGQSFEWLLSYVSSIDKNKDLSNKLMDFILLKTKIFSRFTPTQKEAVISSYNRSGKVTLMCGDGTNDVGALKHAHIGVSILSHGGSLDEIELDKNLHKNPKVTPNCNSNTTMSKKNLLEKRIKNAKFSSSPINNSSIDTSITSANTLLNKKLEAKKKLAKLLQDIEKEGMDPDIVKLGDASIAAPFTSKNSSIQCVCHIIKQGRCTLVTTLQMYTILALNSLILAYSQSVLYLQGVKFSDTQATIQGLLLAICFLSISRSKPLKRLSIEKPLPNIFNICTLSTIFSQFFVHFYCLIFLFDSAVKLSPPKEAIFVDLEADFKPNLINTTVYIISLTLQVSTFVINYRGKPFMESMYENKALLYSLIIPLLCTLCLTLNIFPAFTAYLEIVELPSEFKYVVLRILFLDIAASYTVNYVLQKLFCK